MKSLDSYEQDILQSLENGEWVSKNDTQDRLLQLQSYIKTQKESIRKFNSISKYYSNINTSVCNQ
jgi:hypothetical protein